MMVKNRGNGTCFLSAGGTPCYSFRSHPLLLTKSPQMWPSQLALTYALVAVLNSGW